MDDCHSILDNREVVSLGVVDLDPSRILLTHPALQAHTSGTVVSGNDSLGGSKHKQHTDLLVHGRIQYEECSVTTVFVGLSVSVNTYQMISDAVKAF